MNRKDYSEGYISKANKIKQKRVWLNWSIALGINVLAFFAYSGSAN